ncbi:YdcF family protein [Synechococcus sp. UW179A]|uniref:YdcF family protein n=1 Tax=Synechococcus sp. UW179A TaxID=2575510 RepID=UPI000E0F4032|nr:YdcF family protein [Synechococcus sp. UW179A]
MAYWLSKILPLAVLPLGLSLILLLVGLIGRWRWPVITAVVLLWVFSLGLVSQILWRWLENPWRRQSAAKVPSVDAIVVLSGGRHPAPGAARVSEWYDPDRFFAGLDLYRHGKAQRLLFTGGSSPFRPGQPPEGQRYIEEAQQLGIPAAAMQSTPPVVNTAEEAVAIRQLLQPSDRSTISPRILLVTSAFHMRRAQRLFERQGLKVVPFPVDFQARGQWAGSIWRDPTQWLPSAGAFDSSSRALRELLGRLVYQTW